MIFMLRLVNIKKNYKVADTYVEALKGINLSFRKSEFVSILGPSGCGKTTTLNIIGGLDKYTSGDLFINGKSTKNFKSHDWDVYRNHRVGFIFQSYNLIPHQTILENVALALTIAGISKKEREERAKEALDEVGLKGQYYKHANQLSGGQCQRVAIARALVNKPEILLADEPTGALDTKTSISIMELIKKISHDKLVIMVTHNPDLAKKYSNRIINLLDGEVLDDSNPYSEEDEMKESFAPILNEKAKMSWWTAFKLSGKNLLTKKGRTALVSIAGSIGIIGVASVLSISTGVNDYITSMQDDMLSGNPIQVSESTYDLSTITKLMTPQDKKKLANQIIRGEVNVDHTLDQILSTISTTESFSVKNDITKDYLEFLEAMPKDYYADMSYTYGYHLGNNIYTGFTKSGETEQKLLSLDSIIDNYESVLSTVDGIGNYSGYITSLVSSTHQLPAHNDYILKQYDVVTGHMPTSSNELLLVINKEDSLADLILAELGYFTQDSFVEYAKNSKGLVKNEEGRNHDNDISSFNYDTILSHDFYYLENKYAYSFAGYGTYETEMNGEKRTINYPKFQYKNELDDASITDKKATKLKISGIVKAKSNVNYGCLSTGLYYTEDLAKKFRDDTMNDVVRAKTEHVMTFSSVVKASDSGLNNSQSFAFCTYTYTFKDYTNNEIKTETGYIGQSNSMTSMLSSMDTTGTFASMLGNLGKQISARYIGAEDNPTNVNIYPHSFDEKNKVTDYLDLWNDKNFTFTTKDNRILTIKDRNKVTFTDNVGVIIAMVRTLINIVTSALIAFTALSLVVSCFMIAIITYVSVMERVKEIGVIRSLGGRKKDVNHLFNAETFIIGAISGIIGLLITGIISLVFNIIMKNVADVSGISKLYPYQVVIMLLLSIFLTVISGAIPSRSAAKQDPVNALRSE